MQTKSSNLIQLLLIISLLNISGGLILPLVGPLFLDAIAGIIPGELSYQQRYFSYSLALTFFAFGLLIGEVLWGHLSDQLGRKRTLIFALLGLIIGYISCGFAILMQNLIFFSAGRFVLGLMSGSQSIVIAAILDQSTPENKALHLSWVGLATCLGLISGPLLGGLIVSSYTTTFYYALPFFIMMFFISISFATIPFFHEAKEQVRVIPSPSQLIKSFVMQLSHHPHLRLVMVGYLLFGFGWFLYYQYMSLYLSDFLQYSPREISFFMLTMILVYFLTLSLIFPRLLKLATHMELICGSMLVMAVSIGLLSLFSSIWAAWLFSILYVAANGVAYITWIALFSEQSDKTAQGWAMSIYGLIYAIAWLLAATVVGFLGILGQAVPFVVMSVSAFCSLIVVLYMIKSS